MSDIAHTKGIAPVHPAGLAHVPLEVTMEHYVHRENIALYQRLLAESNVTKDQVRHAMLLELLAAELDAAPSRLI